MTLRELLARREAIRTEMRALHTSAEGNPLAEAAQTRWTELEAELGTIQAAEQRQAMLDSLDRGATGAPLGDAPAAVGLGDVIRAQCGATDAGATRAREQSAALEVRSGRRAAGLLWDMRQVETRVLTSALPVAGPGGVLIPDDFRGDLFINRLRAATRVRALGATVLSGLTGNVSIPRLKTSVNAGWVAENSPLNLSDPAFDAVTLSPRHAGVITEFSRNMLMQASPDVEQLLRHDMALVLAGLLDAAAISGSGTANEPRGILATPGIGSVSSGTNGGAITYAAVVDLMGKVEDADAELGSMAFLTNNRVRRALAKLVETTGAPIGLDILFQNGRTAFTNLVPSNGTKGTGSGLSSLIYGNWSDLIIGFWSELDVLVNPYESSAYSKGNISIRAMMTCDVAVRHPESFAAIADIAAAA